MLLRVGRVGKPHGLRGEVKVVPETEDPTRLEQVAHLYLGESSEVARQYAVESVRFQPFKNGTTIILGLGEVDGIDAAQAIRGLFVYADEEDLPELSDDEWFLDDLIGMSVVLENEESIGTVSDVLELPSHPILVVAREGHSDAMVPAVPEFVLSVDPDANRIVIRPIEGLLD